MVHLMSHLRYLLKHGTDEYFVAEIGPEGDTLPWVVDGIGDVVAPDQLARAMSVYAALQRFAETRDLPAMKPSQPRLITEYRRKLIASGKI